MTPVDDLGEGAPRWAALDGLRGLAVAAVVAYHLGYLPGGFVGVDLFFVLSGFLITSLLLREHARTGAIDLGRFWRHRARRLLPALGVTLVATVGAARLLLDHDGLLDLRRDVLATVAYVANWRFAGQGADGYFATDPSPLRHTWSLAIEEQFYVVLPLVAAVAFWAARRRGRSPGAVVGAVALAGAAASAAWAATHAGSWDANRLYLGTDTRVLAPLTGVALAAVLARRRPAGGRGPGPGAGARTRWPVAALGGLGLAALVAAAAAASPSAGWMHRGGFAAIALAAAAAVAGGVAGGGPVGRVLSAAPLTRRDAAWAPLGDAAAAGPAPVAGAGAPLSVLVVGDSVAYTLAVHAPSDIGGLSVDPRAIPGCGLLTSGRRPRAAAAAGLPARYDDCAEPVAAADRLGLAGRPQVVLLGTGSWEWADHERDGRSVGPGDERWASHLRALLTARVARLAETGARVALWVDPCGARADVRRRQSWYASAVLRPVAAASPAAHLVVPGPVVCRGGVARTDVAGVGNPRPDDGLHWSAPGASWLWRTWLTPTLRRIAGGSPVLSSLDAP